jgi:hypothetical protein
MGDQIHHEHWQKPSPEAQRRLYEVLGRCEKPIIVIERNGLGLTYVNMLRKGVQDGEWTIMEVHTMMGGSNAEIPPDTAGRGGKDALKPIKKHWWEVSQAVMVYGLQADIERRSFKAYHAQTREELLVYARAGPDRFGSPAGSHNDAHQTLAMGRWAIRKGVLQSEREKRFQQQARRQQGTSVLFDLSKGD